MPETEIKTLTKKIVGFRDKRGWQKYHSAKSKVISLLLEAAELLEIFQWTKNNKVPRGRKKQFEEELVDVLYWVLLIAHDARIDLKKALIAKMEKNKKKYPLKRE